MPFENICVIKINALLFCPKQCHWAQKKQNKWKNQQHGQHTQNGTREINRKRDLSSCSEKKVCFPNVYMHTIFILNLWLMLRTRFLGLMGKTASQTIFARNFVTKHVLGRFCFGCDCIRIESFSKMRRRSKQNRLNNFATSSQSIVWQLLFGCYTNKVRGKKRRRNRVWGRKSNL